MWEYYLKMMLEINNNNWLTYFNKLKQQMNENPFESRDIKYKILSLVLCHPNYYPSSIKRTKYDPRGKRGFEISPNPGSKCYSKQLFGYECPIPYHVSDLTMDHIWPYSLGGPTRSDNGMWMCEYHNQLKGYYYLLLTEQHVNKFIWLDSHILNIYDKRRTYPI